MRWVSYVAPDGAERAGVLRDGNIHGIDASLLDLLGAGLAGAAERLPHEVLPAEDVTLRAPLPNPPSIRDFLSFEAHMVRAYAALGREPDPLWYSQPVFYFTNPAAVRGPDATIPISPGCSAFDYEVEVAAVIGREGADLSPTEAVRHIAGYTILCDWSARDVQGTESRLGLGPAKGKDGATSIGPMLLTPDELEPYRCGHGFDLDMSAWVNGKRLGGGNWSDIYWSFGEMIAYASRGTRVVPGDVIGSGTVGTGCLLELRHEDDSVPWLKPGDTVEVRVTALGSLTGRIEAGVEPIPLR